MKIQLKLKRDKIVVNWVKRIREWELKIVSCDTIRYNFDKKEMCKLQLYLLKVQLNNKRDKWWNVVDKFSGRFIQL